MPLTSRLAFVCSIAATLGLAAPTIATPTPLDISAAFNYDAVGTALERTANAGDSLFDTIGDHELSENSSKLAYVNQGSVSAGNVGLPDNGQIGHFQASTTFDNGVGDAKQNNAVRVRADNGTASVTVTLPTAQQQRYSDLNLLFVAARSLSSSGTTANTYRTTITVTYTDSTTQTLFDTGDVAAALPEAGGTLGSAGVGNQGGFANATDTDTSVQVALAMNARMAGDPSQIRQPPTTTNIAAHLWQLTTPWGLDSSKVLESITFTTKAIGGSRRNTLNVLAISATPVPEPMSAALIATGLLACTGRRRRNL